METILACTSCVVFEPIGSAHKKPKGLLIVIRRLAHLMMFVGCSLGQVQNECADLDAATRARVLRTAVRHLPVDDAAPVIDRSSLLLGSCYRQLFLSVPGTNKRTLMFLSPD